MAIELKSLVFHATLLILHMPLILWLENDGP
jgi:hypothetical protein